MTLVAIINDFGPTSLTTRNSSRQPLTPSKHPQLNGTDPHWERTNISVNLLRKFTLLTIYLLCVECKKSEQKFHKQQFGLYLFRQCSVSNSWNKFQQQLITVFICHKIYANDLFADQPRTTSYYDYMVCSVFDVIYFCNVCMSAYTLGVRSVLCVFCCFILADTNAIT